MKKTSMKIITLTILMMMFIMLMFPVSAGQMTGKSPDEVGNIDTSSTGAQKASGLLNDILSVVSVGATIIAVIVLIVLGVKYMTGSTEEKAEYKKTLLPYFVGAIFVFGAGMISSILFNIGNSITAAP